MIKCQSNLKWYNEMNNKVLMYDFKKKIFCYLKLKLQLFVTITTEVWMKGSSKSNFSDFFKH